MSLSGYQQLFLGGHTYQYQHTILPRATAQRPDQETQRIDHSAHAWVPDRCSHVTVLVVNQLRFTPRPIRASISHFRLLTRPFPLMPPFFLIPSTLQQEKKLHSYSLCHISRLLEINYLSIPTSSIHHTPPGFPVHPHWRFHVLSLRVADFLPLSPSGQKRVIGFRLGV